MPREPSRGSTPGAQRGLGYRRVPGRRLVSLILLLDVSAVMGDADEQVCYFYLKRKEKCGLPSFLLKALFIHYVPTCLREKLSPVCKGVTSVGCAEEHPGAGVSRELGTLGCRVRRQTGKWGREVTLRGHSGWSRYRRRNRRFGIGAPALSANHAPQLLCDPREGSFLPGSPTGLSPPLCPRCGSPRSGSEYALCSRSQAREFVWGQLRPERPRWLVGTPLLTQGAHS